MATTQKVSPEQILDVLTAHPGATSAELAEVLGIGQSTAAKHLATLEVGGHGPPRARRARRWAAAGRPVEHHGARADRHRRAGRDGPVRSADRLGRGALGALVREYLAARPGEDLGPTQIGKALGRSQGAVSNALARLEAGGEAQLVTASPRRYRIVESR